jgi:predicted ferric reductase
MAMLRMIPYHIWKASHTLMGPLFLLSAFHTFFVASPLAVGAAPWALMAGVSIVGVIAWCQTLLRKLVPARLVEVERVIPFDGGVDVTFRSKKPMPKFQPGQFVMLSHKSLRAEAHPFTIAGGDEMTRRFVIRAAGDWTNNFVSTVKIGDQFRIGRAVGWFLPQGLKNMIGRAWAMANMSGRIYSEHFDFRGAYGMEHLNYILRPILDAVRNIKPMFTGSVVASS